MLRVTFKRKAKGRKAKIASVLLAVITAISLMAPAVAWASAKTVWGDGVLVAEKAGQPYEMTLTIPDGKGNTYVCWTEREVTATKMEQKSYAQKLGPDGSKQWPSPVLIVDTPGYGYGFNPILTSDGGLAIAWVDNRNKRKPDVFAQKIDADGNKLWGESGKTVYVGPGAQNIRGIVSDSAGGAIVVWFDDERPGLYMQRIGESGALKWHKDGVSINDLLAIEVDDTTSYFEGMGGGEWTNIASDGQGGLYFSWNDLKSPFRYLPMSPPDTLQDFHILLQRVDENGNKAWFSNVSIDVKSMSIDGPMINQLMVLEDNSAVVTWSMPLGKSYIEREVAPNSFEGFPNPNFDYFAARFMPDGKTAWDYSKPLYSMRGDDPSNGKVEYNSVIPVPAKGGILYFENRSTNVRTQRVVDVGDGKKETISDEKQVSNSAEITKFDLNQKSVWKKQFKTDGDYLSPMWEYGPYSRAGVSDKTDSFFLQSSKSENETGQQTITMLKISSETGNELWRTNGKNIPTSKNILDTNYSLDGDGGLYAVWRVGLQPKEQPSPSKYDSGMMPDYQQSSIYMQHIVDDGSKWSDMNADDWAFKHIQNLAKISAVKGYESGEFRPDKAITRAEFTKMIVLTLKVSADVKHAVFDLKGSDVEGHWSANYIQTAVSAGTLKGYTDGTLKPDANITRAEAAVILCRSKGLKLDSNSKTFDDVSKDHWACGSIEAVRGLGVIEGYGDGSFRPSIPVTRAESAKMLDLISSSSE